MTDNIHQLCPALDPDVVLEAAKGEVKSVIVIGLAPDGVFYSAASFNLNVPEALFLLELCKRRLMTHVGDG